MIDYKDLMQKAEFDLERSLNMYNIGDYGFAAYSVQQGLEKYLKAYLLKFNLVTNIQKLGHLQYSEIINEAIVILETQKDIEEDQGSIKVIESTVDNFNVLHKIFFEIQKSQEQKILFWKKSLDIKLDKNEENILNGITVKTSNSAKKYLSALTHYLSSKEFLENLMKKKLPKELKSKIPLILIEYLESIKNGDSQKTKQTMEKFMEIVTPYFYGSGPDSFSKDTTEFMIKLKMLDTTFEWYQYVLLSYPHQEIGRYPTLIGNLNSETLYIENKESLLQLIQDIKTICLKIKSTMSSNYL